MLHCSVDQLPVTYLGIPFSGRQPYKQDWLKLTLSLSNHLVVWNNRYLFFGGRIILINAFISALPTYWISIFELPIWVHRSIDRVRRDFLWSGCDLSQPKWRLAAWPQFYKFKDQGGWGIWNLADFKYALLGKWWWKLSIFSSIAGLKSLLLIMPMMGA